MAFISVRKKDQEPEPEQATEEPEGQNPGEDVEGQEQDVEQGTKAAAVPGFLPAVVIGVRGWFTWCSSRIGAGWTYTLHAVALWAMGYYSLWVGWGIGIGLWLAVFAFMPRPTLDRLSDRLERRGKKTPAKADAASPEEAPAGPPADPLVTLLWQLIADAPGVHLKTLTAALAEASKKAGRPAPDKAAVRASLKARNIPLRPSVRDTRDKVNQGVHREDLETWQNTPPLPDTPPPATTP